VLSIKPCKNVRKNNKPCRKKHNVIHGIAHSPEEALEIVKEKMKNGKN